MMSLRTLQNKVVFIDPTIQVRKYDFQNEKEVLDFYIKMNENITHSKSYLKSYT